MMPFERRIYRNPLALVSDVARLLLKTAPIGRLMRGKSLEPAFRERLMLTVTAVNGCRYCSYAHARHALVAGLSSEEIGALAGGEFGDCPPAEMPALLYAQHWAEADGEPDTKARNRLYEVYGEQAAHAIELALSVIRVGNLGGNTVDHVLHLLSFGRLGRDARGRRAASLRGPASGLPTS